MTSQLILANGHGIALASDSAVTMGGRRTFETSEKIYPLPMPHRMAVMHAGNVMFHGLPFGTIINEWIQSLGDVRLRTVSQYGDSFVSWVLDNYLHWTNDVQLCYDVLNAFHIDFERIWNLMKKLDNALSVDAILELWEREIDLAEKFDPATPESRKVAEQEFRRLWPREEYGDSSLQASFEFWFDDVAQSDEITACAQRYVKASLESRYPGSDRNFTQLIFIGYGSNELLPATANHEFYGAISHLLYSLPTANEQARREGYGLYLIRPSGQFDAIDLVFRGYERGFIEATKSAISKVLESSTEETSPVVHHDESPMNHITSAIENSFYDHSESTKLRGLRRSISGMPLATLARTTKSLIEVQRLSLDIAGELQTVGGQVDVGVITLKEGFNWVRQKDYGDFVD